MSTASAAAESPAAVDRDFEKKFLRYLREHPDFFARNDDELARIAISHGAGSAASLLERQTARLREQVLRMEAQLAGLLEMARINEAHARHLHALSQALLQAPDGEAALIVLQRAMARDFDIEATRVVVIAGDDHAPQQCLALNDALPEQLADCLRTGVTACGPISAGLRDEVFPDQPELQSCAIVPIDRHQRRAFLILASGSAEQFEVGMGTLFLELTAGLVAAVLAASDEQLGHR